VQYYTSELSGSGQFGICIKCHKGHTQEGHDGCLGTLPGQVINACCGHGQGRNAYIQYRRGGIVRGSYARNNQIRIINLRDKG